MLKQFRYLSGLKINPSKSEIFYSVVPTSVKQQILDIISFKEGTLPVKYLSLPLIPEKLSSKDCKLLLEKLASRINSQAAEKLCFAGRVQLIISVQLGIQIYWTSSFILPPKVVKDIENLFNLYLWSGSNQTVHRPRSHGIKFICLNLNVFWG